MANVQKLQAIKSYAEKLGKSELSLKDLDQTINPSQTPKSNKVLYIDLTIVGTLVIGLVAWLFVSWNLLTDLNLSNCLNLTELRCWDNKLTNIEFLRTKK
ncbi:MAG: hypothetical protein I3270_01680 [Candidatus Moeniiplasma glomeromycotorum]|nr:hypothetical protein [Candidatus Moeniiplasma glomeromycotorum]MCE8162417.1 hypothetical protein [Candidatus Moeniiplasma glomeromycotorum]MCE8166343.1 hypothetical protein [Candidatus Moeniiplasma glomeromycotorum]MCE8166825.1 hypothetical protein [Candidatus Moeniiplasma glomeromycotorum]